MYVMRSWLLCGVESVVVVVWCLVNHLFGGDGRSHIFCEMRNAFVFVRRDFLCAKILVGGSRVLC